MDDLDHVVVNIDKQIENELDERYDKDERDFSNYAISKTNGGNLRRFKTRPPDDDWLVHRSYRLQQVYTVHRNRFDVILLNCPGSRINVIDAINNCVHFQVTSPDQYILYTVRQKKLAPYIITLII